MCVSHLPVSKDGRMVAIEHALYHWLYLAVHLFLGGPDGKDHRKRPLLGPFGLGVKHQHLVATIVYTDSARTIVERGLSTTAAASVTASRRRRVEVR